MGDFNKIEGIYEVPIPGPPCPTCEGTGKVKLEGDAEEKECITCNSLGFADVEKSLKLRSRVRNIVKVEYEDWLEYRLRRRVFDKRSTMDVAEFKESMDAVARQIGSYAASWGGETWDMSMKQIPGMVKFLLLLAKDADRLTNERQDVDEMTILKMLKDPKQAIVLRGAIKEITDASPNFLAPPVKGEDD